MNTKLDINIPFAGFYYSWLDSMIDHEVDGIVYNLHEDYPDISEEKWHDLIWCNNLIEYHKVRHDLAKSYVWHFNAYLFEKTELSLELEFSKLVSPREYNFETDRIFCKIPAQIVRELFDRVPPMTLSDKIKERHTSRSGFISFYTNDMQEWLEKPLSEWDLNKLGTLLRAFMDYELEAFMDYELEEGWERDIESRMMDDCSFSEAVSGATNWEALEEYGKGERQLNGESA